MSKRVREKIALLVFAALVIFAGAVLVSYFSTGRTWTQAATLVDDTLGNMNGYSGIVFNGVMPLDGKDDEPAEEPLATGSLAETIKLAMLPFVGRTSGEKIEGPFLSEVRDVYESKGAKVITLDIRDLSKYAKPTVYRAGDKRIGVFSVESYMRADTIAAIVKELKAEGANSIVCITPRQALLGTGEGIDILLLTEDAELMNVKLESGSPTIVESPHTDEIGVILLSSNNVPFVRELQGA